MIGEMVDKFFSGVPDMMGGRKEGEGSDPMEMWGPFLEQGPDLRRGYDGRTIRAARVRIRSRPE